MNDTGAALASLTGVLFEPDRCRDSCNYYENHIHFQEDSMLDSNQRLMV